MRLVSARRVVGAAAITSILAACGTPAQPTRQSVPSTAATSATDLSGIKTYLVDSATQLKQQTAGLSAASDRYYELANSANFEYVALLDGQRSEVAAVLDEAKAAWTAASPGYERIEGIVAGVPTLAEYDVILDAGSAASDDPENAVPFDLTLPDGRVLARPGNLFGILEGALWGTRADFVAVAEADLNGNGTQEFGEALPDANLIKAAATEMDRYAGELATATQAWQPNETDAFTALVVMIPTMSEYFESWKQSRFVLGDASAQSDFAVISRLADIQDILSGLQVVYQNISPLVEQADAAQDQQITQGLTDLRSYVADVHQQEQNGKQFTPEQADTLGAEAQGRATALAGQISQVAAKLNVAIEE